MKPAAPQSAQPSALEALLVEIDKPVYGGACLARVEGKAVFVPLTLPGEQARVRIAQDKRGYATAEAEEIVSAAPQRVAPACRHFGVCGGCHYQHADYAAQLAFKQAILRETLERGGVEAPAEMAVLAGEPLAYRNRIRLALDAAGKPGYRGRRSHAVIAVSECPIAAPLLVKAAQAFAEVARQPKRFALTRLRRRSAGGFRHFRARNWWWKAATASRPVPRRSGAQLLCSIVPPGSTIAWTAAPFSR
jgi:23S rRNA (uracil1939-C5)-methyltransferase